MEFLLHIESQFVDQKSSKNLWFMKLKKKKFNGLGSLMEPGKKTWLRIRKNL